jgi:putative nucleotidyltransferase with HDIG domain
MSAADRRHAVGVAHKALALLGEEATERSVLAAALLHDAGKVEADLGTFGRVAATLVGITVGPGRASRRNGRLSRYLRHDELGARLLAEAGSDRMTVAWAREHHRPPAQWTVPRAVGDALKAADDD